MFNKICCYLVVWGERCAFKIVTLGNRNFSALVHTESRFIKKYCKNVDFYLWVVVLRSLHKEQKMRAF